MTTDRGAAVVVGVDGSDAALAAVRGASEEAVARGVPLRLVHATGRTQTTSQSVTEGRPELGYAEAVLHAAASVVDSRAGSLVQTEILWGAAVDELVAESTHAALLAVGSLGMGRIARTILGSTAAAVAGAAACTVAIIRPDAYGVAPAGWLTVVFDESPDNDKVVTAAMQEARLRGNRVFAVAARRDGPELSYDALDRRVAELTTRFPDVRVALVATSNGIARFVAENWHEGICMVVIGDTDADAIPRLVGPCGDGHVRHAGCSVLLVR
ncbi:universal stress protein [Mycobacterium sp. WMMD1722]|uniref:universal stress protein n=1 Tax=Mycobacterium sp. WMMD1722 TaxID=3404117 RepID=UPI003BF48EED